MPTIKTVKNQSIIGLAVQLFGNVDGFVELIQNNDLLGKMNQLTFVPNDEVDLGYSLFQNADITYDEASEFRDDKELKKLDGAIISDGFILNYYAELLNIFINNVQADTGIVIAALNTAYNQTYTSLDYNASLLIMPGAIKLNTVYAMTREGQAKLLSFVRAGSATELQSDGTRLSVATGMPRNAYDLSDKKTKLLLEPSSTNLISNSEPNNIALGGWGNYGGNCKIAETAGDFNVYKIVEGVTNSDQRALLGTGGHTFSNPHSETMSFQVKAGERSKLRLFAQGATTDIDLLAGTISSLNGKLIPLSDGWWHVEFTATLNEAVFYWIIYIVNDNGDLVYQGDGTSGMYVRHLQIEATDYATSYIPTYGSTVTRPGEVLTADSLQSEGLMDADEATLVYTGVLSTDLQIDLRNSSNVTKYQISSKELYNVVDAASTNDANTPFTKRGGWRYKHTQADTFARDGNITEGANSTTAVPVDKLVITPVKPVCLLSLVIHNTAIDNATLIQQTT